MTAPTTAAAAAAAALQRSAARVAPRPLSTLARAQTSGGRMDTGTVTDTGGSGEDSTALSATLHEARGKVVSMYREVLRDIPAMRENFTIIEDEQFVRRVVRNLFDRHSGIEDPKIVDMLVFKGRQEAGEIRNQWKSRTHVYQHIIGYREEVARANAVLQAQAHTGGGEEVGDSHRQKLVEEWKMRGLVPAEIDSWEQYTHWKADEDAKFAVFAEQNSMFTSEQLQRNAGAKKQCVVM